MAHIHGLHVGLLSIFAFVATIDVHPVNAIECGTVNLYREAMLGGTEVMKDEWPFIAALYYTSTLKYFCGGTIISHKHVLTAAHCIRMKGKIISHQPDEILVRLGAYNLTDRSDQDVVDRNVEQILLHPDWNVNDEKYDADIAILVLIASVTFSNHIRPVCMPPPDFMMDGLVGTVVGWGKTENGSAEGIPRKIEVTAVNDSYCYETDTGIASYASERSFCGESSGTPYEGDSGGGFFAVSGSGWVQYGTVSFIRPKENKIILKFASYTKLTSLRDWIAQQVEQTGGNISLATTKANLHCIYGHSDGGIYGCRLYDLDIRQENFVVQNITGWHSLFRRNEDVEYIYFVSGVMAHIPRNIGNIFRFLKYLKIETNTRRLSRSNFQNLGRLEVIELAGFVAEIDENSLWDLPNLQGSKLSSTNLKVLHPATFSRNDKLQSVWIVFNALLKSLPRDLFRNNTSLYIVNITHNAIESIDEHIFETSANLRFVLLRGNRLRHLSENLFRHNSNLEAIDLGENLIKTIDAHSFQACSKLTFLTIDTNQLDFVPAQLLRGLEFLSEIFIVKNSLKAIDEQFFETNIRIRKISLQSNQLSHIPADLFRNNPKLVGVNFESNFLDALDENLFAENSLLEIVNLNSNLFADLPWNLFRQNAMLVDLSVESNLLETLDERTFEGNPRLKVIKFKNNRVTSLPAKIFHNNTQLEFVAFDRNSLETLDEGIFQTNAILSTVNFASNGISSLPEHLFRNNPLLQFVDFSSNLRKSGRLESLPRNLFQGNSLLRTVDISENFLQFIEIDFTNLEYAYMIDLTENSCIDARFHNIEAPDEYRDALRSSGWTNNLTEFQGFITANCSRN